MSDKDHNVKCPQFRYGGPFYLYCNSCFSGPFKNFKDHTCLVRGNDDVFRMRKGSCFCCQLGHNAAFHTPTPPYAFGPNKGNPPKCKLASTDLFLSTAVALWHHKHDVFHSLVRNHWGYRMKWSAVYGNDTTKHFGRDELPLLSFYEWLHEYWFDGNTPIRCVHAVFILFLDVAKRGTRSVDEIKQQGIHLFLRVRFGDGQHTV